MADSGSELQEEVEALEAIYIHELEVIRNERDEVSQISLQLHPATGDEEDKKYVCMTLQLSLPEDYPHSVPTVAIRNPRGIGDEEIHSLLEDMKQLAMERLGGPMLYELIELAKDSLTVGNIPHCLCMICLDHFHEGERFTRTDCYHYFHKSCLARYIQHFLSNNEEPAANKTKLTLHMNQEKMKVQCPVCREEIRYEEDSLTFSPVEEKFFFKPTKEMKQLQAEMAERLERQRAAGGLIDVDAEKNRFLLKNDDVVQLPAKPVEDTNEGKKSPQDRRDNDKFSLRRNRGRPDSLDKNRDRPDNRDKNENNRTNRDARHKNERNQKDFHRPSSDYVRGKGRGKQFEDRNYNKVGGKDKNEHKDKSREVGKNKSENKKADNGKIKDEKLRSDVKTESSETLDQNTRTENLKTENDSIPSEKQDRKLSEPRFDEKINDKHKEGHDSEEKMTDITLEFSSQREAESGAAGSSKETFSANEGAVEKDSHTTKENDDKNDDKFDSSKNKKQTGRGGFGKPSYDNKDGKSSPNKGDNAKNVNEHGNERHKGRGGFGKPNSDYKDRQNNQSESEKSKSSSSEHDNRHKRRGGFGKPPSEQKSEEGSDNLKRNFDRPNKSYRQYRNNNERHGSGKSGSGKMEDRFYNAHERHDADSEQLHDRQDYRNNGKHKPDEFDKQSHKNHTGNDDTNNYCDQGYKGKRHHGGFGKPGFENRKNDREKQSSDHVQSRNKPDHKAESWDEIESNDIGPELKNETQKPRGGFGKPNSNRNGKEMKEISYDDLKDKENTSEFSGDVKGKAHDEHKNPRRGGFGRPNSSRKSNEENKDDNWNETNRHPYDRDHKRGGNNDKRPRGGFGKPKDKSETQRHDGDENDDYDSHNWRRERGYETTRNDRHDHKDYQRSDCRNYQRNEHRNDYHRNNHRNKYRNDHIGDNRNDHSQNYRNDFRKDYRKENRNDTEYNDKDEKLDGTSKSDNWKERKIEHRDKEDSRYKYNHPDNRKHFGGGTQGDSKTRDGSSFKDNDRKCDTSATKAENMTENVIRHNCDTGTESRSDRISHPPGFKVGPPPGFQKEKKSTESIKPPPGF